MTWLPKSVGATDLARSEMRTDALEQVYGLTGKGVTVVILDRGIDWSHPDFIKADGKTRIKALLDFAPGSCATTEYTEAQINAALSGATPALPTRDAVGHGTVTAGAAAGNGRAAAGGKYRGIAPEADLLIAKITGGAAAHGNQPAEQYFYCGLQAALTWAVSRAQALNQPFVVLPNVGTQYGPIDGTDAESRLVDTLIGENTPGRVFSIGIGDEGGMPNHAGGDFNGNADTVLPFSITTPRPDDYIQIWYTGSVPATVVLTMADGTTVGPVAPGNTVSGAGGAITIAHTALGQDWFQSTSGDRMIMINLNNRTGSGEVHLRALGSGTGRFDAYSYWTNNLRFTSLLAPGRISGIAATRSAIVTSVYVDRTTWVDVDGISRTSNNEGLTGARWTGSSSGPTRDGRSPGCDVSTPGHHGFAAYGRNTEWALTRAVLIQDGAGWYGQYGAASGSAPLLSGAIALLLQLDPTLTAARVRQALRLTARQDAFTGAVPNNDWCFGKADFYRAALAIADSKGDPGVIEFAAAAASAAESAGNVDITLKRLGGRQGAVSVQYRVAGGTATDGQDYSGGSGTVTWQDGDVSDKTIRLSITDDTNVESAETVILELTNPMSARVGWQRQTILTIADNDVASPPPSAPPSAPAPTPSNPSPTSGGGGGILSLTTVLLLLCLLGMRIAVARTTRTNSHLED